MNRRDVFRGIAAAFVAAMVPVTVRRIAADADPADNPPIWYPDVASLMVEYAAVMRTARWSHRYEVRL